MQDSMDRYQNNFTVARLSLIWGNGILPAHRCYDTWFPVEGALCTVPMPWGHMRGSGSLVVSHPVFVSASEHNVLHDTCANTPPHPVQEASFLINAVSYYPATTAQRLQTPTTHTHLLHLHCRKVECVKCVCGNKGGGRYCSCCTDSDLCLIGFSCVYWEELLPSYYCWNTYGSLYKVLSMTGPRLWTDSIQD